MSSERWIRPEVRIVLCRCQATRKLFGQRLEQTAPSTWTATWAFKISEGNAKQEGYESVSLTDSFNLVQTILVVPSVKQCLVSAASAVS